VAGAAAVGRAFMAEEVSILRLYLMRGMYLLNFLLVGSGVCAAFLHRAEPWGSITGVAFSFWAALSALSLLGIRYPLAMLPLLFIQLLYKTVWLIGVYVPLRAVGRSSDLTQGFAMAIMLDIIVIPWSYVLVHYVKKPGDRRRGSLTRRAA
jgi:hypothetical protein